jgi:sporulation protein YlmC with PRC-barrel domain
MFAKYMSAGLIGSALLATAAFAQTPAATNDRATAAPVTASDSNYSGNWRASKVIGLNVYNANDESLGSINDLLMDKGGSIKAAVISVGGFLGVGSHLVAVPLDKVKFVTEPITTASTSNGNAGGTSSNRPPSSGVTTGAAPATPAVKPNPWYPDHAVFDATKDQLKAMPEFKYSTE